MVRMARLVTAGAFVAFVGAALLVATSQATESNQKSSTSTSSSSVYAGSQSRQAVSVLGTIGSLLPGLLANVAPLLLLVGVGVLMMPGLGLGALGLLRESRRSSSAEQPLFGVNQGMYGAQYARPLHTSPQDMYYFTKRSLPGLMSGLSWRSLQDTLERVGRALENADKRWSD